LLSTNLALATDTLMYVRCVQRRYYTTELIDG
jgi:hypothetical protein